MTLAVPAQAGAFFGTQDTPPPSELSVFGADSWWLVLIKALVIFICGKLSPPTLRMRPRRLTLTSTSP